MILGQLAMIIAMMNSYIVGIFMTYKRRNIMSTKRLLYVISYESIDLN